MSTTASAAAGQEQTKDKEKEILTTREKLAIANRIISIQRATSQIRQILIGLLKSNADNVTLRDIDRVNDSLVQLRTTLVYGLAHNDLFDHFKVLVSGIFGLT